MLESPKRPPQLVQQTKAVFGWTWRSRESWSALNPFAPFVQRAIANRISRNSSLRLAKIVSEDHAALGGELPAADIPIEKAKVLRLKNTTPFLTAPVTAARAWRYQSVGLKARLGPVEAAYAQAIAREPAAEQGTALVARASLRAGTYDLEGAISDYDKAIAIEPDAASYTRRGSLKRQLGQVDAAIEDFREALKLSPSVGGALTLADTLGYAGKSEEALKLLAEYDDMGDEHSSVVQVRSDVLAYAGKAADGLNEINALIEEKPGDTSLLNASCWYRARFRIGAEGMMQVCNQAVERASNASAVLDSRAMAGIASGNLVAALADAEAALTIAPGQVSTQYVRAWIANAMGKSDAKTDLAYFRKVMPGLVQEYARYGLR